MLVTVKKETEEIIEIKTPAWFVNNLSFYAHITEGGDLIEVYGGVVSLREADHPTTKRDIATIVKEYHSCSEEQFKEALDKRLFKLEEAYTKA